MSFGVIAAFLHTMCWYTITDCSRPVLVPKIGILAFNNKVRCEYNRRPCSEVSAHLRLTKNFMELQIVQLNWIAATLTSFSSAFYSSFKFNFDGSCYSVFVHPIIITAALVKASTTVLSCLIEACLWQGIELADNVKEKKPTRHWGSPTNLPISHIGWAVLLLITGRLLFLPSSSDKQTKEAHAIMSYSSILEKWSDPTFFSQYLLYSTYLYNKTR